MKVTFLGTGTSCGVPTIGCDCEVCTSKDPRDKRLRTSALVETAGTRVLIDCGPDFRQQVLPLPFSKIDGILLTHAHYDHVAGIDDVRPFSRFGDVDIYADSHTSEALRHNLPYCFAKEKYPGVPDLNLHTIEPHKEITIGDITVMPIRVMHGKLPILGYRFGRFAYITDMKTIEPQEMAYLDGVEVLAVNALRFEKYHHSHQLVPDAIEFARSVGAKRTLFIHANHDMGLHAGLQARFPEGFEMAYDGLVIEV